MTSDSSKVSASLSEAFVHRNLVKINFAKLAILGRGDRKKYLMVDEQNAWA
jgi:hypothetical protein